MARPRRLADFMPGYWEHASHESMTAYLRAAERDLRDLTRMVEVLRAQRDKRKAETERGEWPVAAVPGGESKPESPREGTQK